MKARRYDLNCPVARALDLIGERWTILIVRDLLLEGPRRFQDFETSLSGITPAVLSSRLKELEARGIVEKRLYLEHPPRPEYSLTAKGRELGPVLQALRQWGKKYGKASKPSSPHASEPSGLTPRKPR